MVIKNVLRASKHGEVSIIGYKNTLGRAIPSVFEDLYLLCRFIPSYRAVATPALTNQVVSSLPVSGSTILL